jgi:uncharacterized protein
MWSILPSAHPRSAPRASAGDSPPPPSRPDEAARPGLPVAVRLLLLVLAAAPIILLTGLLSDFLVTQAAFARLHRHGWLRATLSRHQTQQQQKKLNDAAVMILGGRPGATTFDIAHDIAAALVAGDGLRLIPLDAAGGIDSLRDLLLLRGVDLALAPANVLGDAGTEAALGPGLRDRLAYVTLLYGEELHVLAGPGVPAVENLGGRKIAVPPDDAGAELAVRDIMRRLGVEAAVVRVAPADAIDDVRSGALGALVLTGGKPVRFVAGLPKDGSVRLLALPPQASDQAGDGYSPGRFDAGDYPALIAAGQTIDTVAVSAVLVARNADRQEDSYRRVARFVPAFFGALSDLAGPRWHPKWREVNLAATLGGWMRFPAATEWLDTAMREQSASVQRDFDEFLRANTPAGAPPPSAAARRQLFEQYLTWTRRATQMPR